MMSAYTQAHIDERYPGGKWKSPAKCWMKSPLRPEERTASFEIDIEKKVYFDHGTGEGGKLSELFKLTGHDDPYRSENGAAPAVPRSQESIQRQAARELWEQATEGEGHPYLHRKKVEANGTRRSKVGVLWKDGALKKMSGDFLLVPAYDSDGSLIGLEQVTPDGKKYALGSKGFHILDDLNPDAPLVVAEGFATAASIKALSAANTASCFGAANFESAVRALRKVFPGEIVVAPDAGTDVRIPGVAVVELPSGSEKNDDWNDLHAELGIEDARAFFNTAWDNRKVAEGVVETEPPETGGITIVRADRLRYQPREHLIKGLLQQNSLNVVFGVSAAGKTFFCLDMALSIASGQTFLGRRTMQGPTIYVCAEGSDELAKRLDAWDAMKSADGVSYQNGLPIYVVPHAVVLSQASQKQELIDKIMGVVERDLNGATPVAVFIDTLARCSDGDENSNEDMSLFVAAADELRTRLNGPAVIIIHHTPKSNPEDMRGASALRGALNSAICLSLRGAGTQEEQCILMRCDKQKDLPSFPDQALARVQVQLPYCNYYGEPETSCIIELREHTPETIRPLSPSEKQVLEAFLKAAPVAGTLDNTGRFIGLTRDALREQFKTEFTGEAKDATRRGALKSGIDGLIARGRLKKTGEDLFRLDGPTAELEEADFAKKLKERWGVGGRCEALPTTHASEDVSVGAFVCVPPPYGGERQTHNGTEGQGENPEQKPSYMELLLKGGEHDADTKVS